MSSVSASCEARTLYRSRIEQHNLTRFELAECADNLEHWISQWVWTYNPRRRPAYIPLALWPKQIEFVHWLEDRDRNQEGGLVEKSRDSGVSVLCCAMAVHRWRFRDGYSVGFGSRKEVYVDNPGDPDSIFEKLRIIIGNLPTWMLPAGFDSKRHLQYCKIINPENGNTITGEAGDNIGRGGRKSVYFPDEAAFLERPHLVDRALAANTDVRIDISTPNGIGNPFYTKRFSGAVPVFTFRWQDDPRKNPEWVAKKRAEIGPTVWAQEYEIDYSASLAGVFIPAEWVRAAVDLDLPASGPIVAGLDIGEEGPDATVLTPRQGPLIVEVVSWGHCNTNQTAYRVIEECRARGVSVLHFDAVGVGTGPKGVWQDMALDDEAHQQMNGHRKLPFIAVPIHGGTPASERYWPDGQSSAEKFQDVNGELWWLLRQRFERTYEFVTQGVQHRPEDMISIPNESQLIAELSMPLVIRNERGKIGRESKKAMAKRGVKSPDFAESLAYSFNPWDSWEITGSPTSDSTFARAPRGTFQIDAATRGGGGSGGGGDMGAGHGGGEVGIGESIMGMRF